MKHRTNIELEMDYVDRIMTRYGIRTKTEAVDLALQRLAAEIPLTKEEFLGLHGSMPDFEVPPRDRRPVEEI